MATAALTEQEAARIRRQAKLAGWTGAKIIGCRPCYFEVILKYREHVVLIDDPQKYPGKPPPSRLDQMQSYKWHLELENVQTRERETFTATAVSKTRVQMAAREWASIEKGGRYEDWRIVHVQKSGREESQNGK